jgi:futalosine hydrolase
MRCLLVAATELELAPLVARLTPASPSSERVRAFTHASHHLDVLTTGVGMIATATWCARVLAGPSYDLAINLGVCGSFDPAYPPGTVVHVTAECIPELGAEDGEEFLTVQQLGLLGPDDPPFRGGRLVNPAAPPNRVIAGLRTVTGITVNTVHGNEQSIARVVERFRLREGYGGHVQPAVETMEGAAFMYACLVSGARFAQVRAVSNMVEKRNRGAWKLAEAVAALNDVALRLIEQA